ncbi:Ig-like domain repeat protein [Rufibacter tibetensis]|uniref:Secretion system C-terminal sorting domain-containing protein n=1 Tax=Rufibacter tibetensis TaxID=512763 RepID=A0A0P0C3T5_9BACT|nr:Ig-like domain repeat protein [Rufibacter tibetensis]ALI97708.1 hypothetical protein DC20_00260 [Rufibacter tibetensis]
MDVQLLPPSRIQVRRYGFLLILFFSLFLSGEAFAQNDAYTAAGLPKPTVKSDKDDYVPGEVAIITGTGWTKDQQVDVHFEETPAYHTEHQHDYHGVTVDANGNWTIKYPIEVRHLGVAFEVHAVGKSTGYEALAYFTDGAVTITASTGGGAISADKANGAWTELGNIVMAESKFGDISYTSGSGTIVLEAPEGFMFDNTSGGPAPEVILSGSSIAGDNINMIAHNGSIAITVGTGGKTLTITILHKSKSSPKNNNTNGSNNPNTLIWQNLRVRPTAGTPLATGNIKYIGTATFETFQNGATTSTPNYGTLTMIPGAAAKLAFVQQPTNANAGATISPVTVQVQDKFGNFVSTTRSISLSINNSGTLAGTTTVTSNSNGLANFNDFRVTTAGKYRLTAGSAEPTPGLTSPPSSEFTINSVNANTATALASSVNPSVYAQNVTFTATVSTEPTGGTPTGTVTFYNGATAISNAIALTSGVATFTTSMLGVNTIGHTIKAIYTPTGNFNASPSDPTVTQVVKKADQAITFAEVTGKTFGDAAFAIAPSASSGLVVSISTTGGISYDEATGKVSITAAGPASITASQAGDANYNAATAVKHSFTVAKAGNAITFTNPGEQTYAPGKTVALNASATSGGAVTFAVTAGNATVSGSTLTLTGAGSVTVKASSATTTNYLAAADESVTFSVKKADQTITFAEVTGKTFGDAAFAIAPSASSGLVVSISTTGGISYDEATGKVSITAAGPASITASQAGDANYNAATAVKHSFTVAKAGNAITFTNPGEQTYAPGKTVALNASATSGGAVTFAVTAGNATVSGSTLTLTGAGSVTVKASSATTTNYLAAADESVTFSVKKADQTITFAEVTGKTFGDAAFAIAPSASSGLVVSISTTGGISYDEATGKVSITAAGPASITASQAGDANYNAATAVKHSFTVAKAGNAITFTNPGEQTYAPGKTVALNASATSGGAVTFAVTAGNATVSGSTLTLTGAGSVTVKASSATTTNYLAAADESVTFSVKKADQTITFAEVTGKTFGDAAFAIAPSASSGLVVSISTTGGISYDEATGKVSITAAGPASITASQAGDANYNAATAVKHSFTVAKAATTTLVTVSNTTYNGSPQGGTAKVTGAGGLDQALTVTYSGTDLTNYPASVTAPTDPGTYSATASYAATANYQASVDTKPYTISKATTTTNLIISAGTVRFMDKLTMTAQITPLNTANALTGSVEFKIGTVSYGTVAVVPVPGATDGTVQATLIKQVSELPGNYTVNATFSSTNSNYAGSVDSKSLVVRERPANPMSATAGFYTGDVFAWTTSSTSSKATMTLIASLKDNEVPNGDLRAAKVTFYYVNGTTYTPIPSAKDIPVGLLDVNDGSVGYATATVQFDIGSNNAQDYLVAVGVSGAYTNNHKSPDAQTIITVSKPVPGGFIVGGSQITNAKSNGQIKGHTGMNTDYQFDISYTKTGSNPKGKAKVMVRSFYKADGTLDNKLHTYVISTNAISTLSITKSTSEVSATGIFTAKANLDEHFDDGRLPVAIEGGSTFQMEAYQKGCTMEVAITLFRKAGGIWFSSNWNGSKTERQAVATKSVVYVEGGGNCTSSTQTISKTTAVVAIPANGEAKAEAKLASYPNPLIDETTVEFSVAQNEEYSLDVYDMKGALVKHLQKGKAANDETITAKWDARTSNVGVYIIRLSTNNKVKTLRVVRQ